MEQQWQHPLKKGAKVRLVKGGRTFSGYTAYGDEEGRQRIKPEEIVTISGIQVSSWVKGPDGKYVVFYTFEERPGEEYIALDFEPVETPCNQPLPAAKPETPPGPHICAAIA